MNSETQPKFKTYDLVCNNFGEVFCVEFYNSEQQYYRIRHLFTVSRCTNPNLKVYNIIEPGKEFEYDAIERKVFEQHYKKIINIVEFLGNKMLNKEFKLK